MSPGMGEAMREDSKIGYLAIALGAIALWEAWSNIFGGHSNLTDIFILSMGLISSLLGIALVVIRKKSAREK